MIEALFVVVFPVILFVLLMLLGHNLIESTIATSSWMLIALGLFSLLNWANESNKTAKVEHESTVTMPINAQEKPAS